MLRTLCRGLAALVTLALLLVGLPALLAVGTLAVTRQADPQQTDLVDLLTRPDNGNLFLWALVVIGWIAWLCFAVSVLLELPAQLRGRATRRVFALGWSQRMAGGLVGAVLALLPTAGAALAATPASVTTTVGAHAPLAVVAAAPATAPSPNHVPAGAASTAHTSSQPSYTVKDERPADSLWSIAEKQLGSGPRWEEIARLNQGRTMDAQGRRFEADQPIQPGWVLLMPADALADPPAAAPAAGSSAAGQQTARYPATVQLAPPAAQPQHTVPAGTHIVVRPGDTLSALAQQDLGNADKWPELFAANKGVRAPDGVRLNDPDLIEPGMVLTVPGAAAPVVPPPVATPPVTTPPVTTPPGTAPPAGTAPTAPPHSSAPTAGAHPTAHPTAHPSAPVGGVGGGATAPTTQPPATHQPATHQPSATPPATAAPRPTGNDAATPPTATHSALPEDALIGGTALLAAVLLGALAVRRRNSLATPPEPRSRTRARTGPPPPALPASLLDPGPTGSAIPEPELIAAGLLGAQSGETQAGGLHAEEPVSAFEAAMSARQDASGLDLLDRALRSLATSAAAEGRRLPALTAVRITPDHTVELHLATPASPLLPFRAAHASTVWWCTPDADYLLSTEAAATVPAPYPALVSLGTAEDGSIVLVDLEAVRLVHLSGAQSAVNEVLRTLALELAFTPLADQITVHSVGVAPELRRAADGRLQVHPDLPTAVEIVAERDEVVRRALVDVGAITPREARSRGTAGAAWAPEIVLCTSAPVGETPEKLGRMLDASPRGSVAVVTAAPPPGAGPMARWTLSATGTVTLPGLGMSIELQHLSDHQYMQWLGLLGAELAGSRQGPDLDPALEPDPDPELDDDPEPGFGPAGYSGPTAVPDPPAFVADPAPDPDPDPDQSLDHDLDLGPDLGPHLGPGSDHAADPAPAPRPAPEPRLDLAPALDPWSIRSAWPQPALVPDPDTEESVEAAHELTLRRLRAGDHQGAEAAAFAGLTPAPDTELLHRDLLCVYADAGATDQLNKAVTRLERLPSRTGRPLEPETDALIAELRGAGGAA